MSSVSESAAAAAPQNSAETTSTPVLATRRQRSDLRHASKSRSGARRGRRRANWARLVTGSIVLALGLGLGVTAVQALWWEQSEAQKIQLPRGQVGLAVSRVSEGSDTVEGIRLLDSSSEPKSYSTFYKLATHSPGAAAGTTPEPDSEVGTKLSGILTGGDAKVLLDGKYLYVRYEVTAQAPGNAQLTYDVTLDGLGAVKKGATLQSTLHLFRLPTEYQDITCEEAFPKVSGVTSPDDPWSTNYAVYHGDGKEPQPVEGHAGITTVVGVDYKDYRGTDRWCLVGIPGSWEYSNLATVEAWTVRGKKSDTAKWGVKVKLSATGDQARVGFQPTVSRWDQN